MRFGLLQVVMRVLAMIILLLIISRQVDSPSPEAASPRPVALTHNRQLQLLRLFHTTNGIWTETQIEEYQTLLGISPQPAVSVDEQELLNEIEAFETALKAEEYATAENILTTMLELDPANQQANFWKGLLLLPDPSALPYLQQAAAVAGDHQSRAALILSIIETESYELRDLAVQQLIPMGLWGLAERLLSLQVEQDNFDATAFAYRGFVRDLQGKDGRSDIEMALTLEPRLSIGYYMLGLHERLLGNPDASVDAFLAAAISDPENPAFAAELATAYRLSGSLALAEEWYLKAANLALDDERFIVMLANFYAEEAYLEGAGMAYLRQAVEDYPENADLLTSLGIAQLALEDINGAEESLQAAYALAPDDPRLHYFMGELMLARLNRPEAIAHFFLVTQTDNPYAAAAQEMIDQLSR